MAILVMLIIIVLNIGLLVLVMRVGTQGEHHSEFTADQSAAVIALHDKLGLPRPEPKQVAVVQEHAKDVANTVDPDKSAIPATEAEAEKSEVTQDNDEIAQFVDGDDTAEPLEEIAVDTEEAKDEIEDIVEDAQEAVTDDDDSDDDD